MKPNKRPTTPSLVGPQKVLSLALLLLLHQGTLRAEPTQVLVGAAASLKETVEFAQASFQKTHPEIAIKINLGSSGSLGQQIENGAPVDLFISAGKKPMDHLTKVGLAEAAAIKILAHNRLQLILSTNAPALHALTDLDQAGIQKIAVGEPTSVPVGQYTQEALEKAHLWQSLTPKFVFFKDVRQVLTAVATGNAEAGFVYATDARVSQAVRVALTIPEELHQPIVYPMVILKNAPHSQEAQVFEDFLQSPEMQAQMKAAGFE